MKIEDCVCGRKASLTWFDFCSGGRVSCSRKSDGLEDGCWIGPYCKTKNEAIAGWNAVMAKMAKTKIGA